jgi:phosphoserine phosphatase RsbU/P
MLTPRAEFALVALGAIFLFIGVSSCCIAGVRASNARPILGWFGIFSALYGVRLFAAVPAAFSLLVGTFSRYAPQAVWIITYVIMISALLFWAEVTLGILRRLFQIMVIPACAIAVAGIFAVLHGRPQRLMLYNNVVVICSLLALAVATLIPRIARKYLAVRSPIAAAGTLILAFAVIHDNLNGTFLNLRSHPFLEPVALALFVLSQGWVAAEKVFADERRLLSIENELAIAREIQSSILPSDVPKLSRLGISAAYCPMTAVAGDFYWFIATDPNRAGFLVADVSGHGVPAALIASMIKVAMQSVVAFADDPAAVLCGVEHVLSGQLRGDQFVSAAYLWLDTENGKALYSAAGHPPLLRWSRGKLENIQSNGLVFGVLSKGDYPVCEIPIATGDRFLLYTDGIIEPENAKGESFGDRRLEEVVRENQCRPSIELSDRLLSELRQWQPASAAQQDDITLIVIDVLQKKSDSSLQDEAAPSRLFEQSLAR